MSPELEECQTAVHALASVWRIFHTCSDLEKFIICWLTPVCVPSHHVWGLAEWKMPSGISRFFSMYATIEFRNEGPDSRIHHFLVTSLSSAAVGPRCSTHAKQRCLILPMLCFLRLDLLGGRPPFLACFPKHAANYGTVNYWVDFLKVYFWRYMLPTMRSRKTSSPRICIHLSAAQRWFCLSNVLRPQNRVSPSSIRVGFPSSDTDTIQRRWKETEWIQFSRSVAIWRVYRRTIARNEATHNNCWQPSFDHSS